MCMSLLFSVLCMLEGDIEPFTEITLKNISCFLLLAWMHIYSFLVLAWMHTSRGLQLGGVSDSFWGKAPDSFGKYMPELFGWSAHFLECRYRLY